MPKTQTVEVERDYNPDGSVSDETLYLGEFQVRRCVDTDSDFIGITIILGEGEEITVYLDKQGLITVGRYNINERSVENLTVDEICDAVEISSGY